MQQVWHCGAHTCGQEQQGRSLFSSIIDDYLLLVAPPMMLIDVWCWQGFVYLKFTSVEGSAAAQKALHGRWFAGRQTVAEFQFTAIYGSYFQV